MRREETAQATGVGLSWYTWLEQGRDINISANALARVARALRLSEADVPQIQTVLDAYRWPAFAVDPVWNLFGMPAHMYRPVHAQNS